MARRRGGSLTPQAREGFALALGLLGSLLVVLAIVTAYVNDAVFDSEEFADRAAIALDDPDVRDALAAAVADAAIEQDSELIPLRPIIEFGAEAIVETASFEALFRAAVEEGHRLFFDGEGGIAVRVGDLGLLLSSVIAANNPEVAAEIPPELTTGFITISERTFAAETVALGEDVRQLELILTVLGLLALIGGLLLTRQRRRFVAVAAMTIALLAVLAIVVLSWVRDVVLDQFDQREVADAVWGAFVDDLTIALLLSAAAGAIVTGAAASLLSPLTSRPGALKKIWARVGTTPRSALLRVIRGLAIVVVGVLVAFNPISAVQLVALLIGVAVLFFGITEVLGTLEAHASAAEVVSARRAVSRAIRLGIGIGAIAIAMAAAVLLIGSGDSADAAQEIDACNGHPELCDRPVNRVAMAASHNSMSAAQDDHAFAMHDAGILAQLNGGIRALQVDTWFGIPQTNFVSTELPAGTNREEQIELFGEAAVNAAERLREQSEADAGERSTYLCHGYCEYGSTPLVGQLAEIEEWLRANPHEVINLIIQDMITPEATVDAFEQSGLIDLVYHHDGSQTFPTMREMIASNQRVIVMAENDSGTDVDWYLQAFDYMEEVPFRNESLNDFGCEPDRGGTGKPFFQLNHWIQKPAPATSDAEVVNARDFMLPRARRCESERGTQVSVAAVNFWGIGDAVEVVDELNGVAPLDSAGG